MIKLLKCLAYLTFLGLVKGKICSTGQPCIPVTQCPEIYNLLNVNILEHNKEQMIKNAYCGYLAEPYVCCDRNCTTPNNNYGNCIELENCPALQKAKLEINKDKLDFLLEAVCLNKKNGKTYVCCNGDEDNYERSEVPDILE